MRLICAALFGLFLLAGCSSSGGGGGGSSAPEAEIVTKPNAVTNSTDAGFALASNQTGSTFACQLDGGGYSACTTPKDYTGLADGDHTFCATATNDAGKTSTETCYTWTVDTVAPETTLTSTPTKPLPSDAPDFGFTSSEADSTFTCVLDGGAPDACTSPHGYTGIADGSHEFCVAATDPAGNTDPTPACHDWDTDVTPPSIAGASDLVREATGASGAAVTFATPTATDAIGPVTVACVPASGGTFALGSQTVTCTATDDAGNTASTSFDVTVQDTTDPLLTVPGNVTVEAPDATTPAATGTATATDIVDAAPAVTFADAEVAGSGQLLKTITRTWTATDASGNSATADQVISVMDTTAPALSVPSDATVEAPGDSTPATTGTATATDAVDATPSVTFADAEVAGTGQTLTTITRTWTATDASGNSTTADQTVTVMDTTPPVLSVPADLAVADGDDTTPAATGTATATDAVDPAPVVDFSDSEVAGTGDIVKVITRTWTATDASGNSASGDQTITVTSGAVNLPPDPTAPDINTFLGSSGTSQVDPNDPDVGQSHTYAIVTAPLHGGASVDTTGLVTYTPDTGYTGDDSLEVEVTDDGAPALSGSVVIAISVRSPLALTITANPDPAQPGQPIFYEVRVANVGPTTLADARLSLTVPNNGSMASSRMTGALTCGSISCGAGVTVNGPLWTLAPGQVETVTFQHAVTGGGGAPADGTLIHLETTVSQGGAELSATRDVEVQSADGLDLAMNEDLDPVAPGGRLTYTLDLGNPAVSALPATGSATLVATIPAGTTFASASAGGTPVGDEVQWTVGFVDAGARQRYTFSVDVGGGVADGTVLTSRAEVLDLGAQSLVRAMTATIARAAVPLTLTTIANPDPAHPGQPTFYEVRVANVGAFTQSDVRLTITVPNNGSMPSSRMTGALSCGSISCGAGVLVTGPLWTLAPGQVETVTFQHAVTGGSTGPADGTLIRATARVNYGGGDLSLGTDVAVQDFVGLPTGVGLQLDMNEDLDPVAPGGLLTYTIDLGNPQFAGLPSTADGVLVATVPAGTAFVSADGGGAEADGVVTWDIGFVDAGARQRYTFTVEVDGAAQEGDMLTSRAEVVVTGGQAAVRATTATIVQTVPLTLTTIANPDPAHPGQPTFYEVRVANVGAFTQTDVRLTITVPNNGSMASSRMTGALSCGSISCGAGVLVTGPLWTLAPGQVETVTFQHAVTGGSTGPADGTLIRATARVDYGVGDLSLGTDVAVSSFPGLEVAMNEDRDPAAPGGQVVYTIDLGNPASSAVPAAADGVLVASVPAGTAFVSADGGGAEADGVVTWDIGFVDAGARQRYTFTVDVAGAAQDGDVLTSDAAVVVTGGQALVRGGAATIVRDSSPLALSVSATPDPVTAGSGISYSIDVQNVGATTLTGVVLRIVVPNNGSSPASLMTGGLACGSITCGAGVLVTGPAWTLLAGETQTVTFVHNVTGGSTGPSPGTLIHAVARVDSDGGDVSLARDVVVGP